MAGSARAPGVMIGLSQPASDGDDDYGTSWPRAVAPDETSPGSSAVRKPRGRPPGSKNKPKQPVVASRGRASALHPVVLQFDGGFDIVSGLSDYVRRNRVGVSVLGASGVVSGVSLRQYASVAHGLPGVFTLQGRFDILSLSGTLFPPSATAFPPGHFFSGTLFPPGVPQPPPLTVSLVSSRGQVIAGAVMGSMSAAGPVLIMAATFSKPEFLRLPISDDDNEAAVVDDDDDSGADPVTHLATSLPSNLIDLNALPVRLSRNSTVLLAQPNSVRPPPHAHPPPPHY